MGVKTFTHRSPTHSQDVLEKLNALRCRGQLCDVTLRVQGQVFLAHKAVLACCSDFFRTQLLGGAHGRPHVLELHHVTASGFAPLLEYAYTSTLSVTSENIIDVLAAASYMQMFAVASTCSEFMKSSVLWNGGGGASMLEKPRDPAPDATPGRTPTPLDGGSPSPASSECSALGRAAPVPRGSRRKRKAFVGASAESPLKSPPLDPSPSFPEAAAQAPDSSLAFPWTFPFGLDHRFRADRPKQPESLRCLDQAGPPAAQRLADYFTCDASKEEDDEEEDDVHVKVEQLSEEEAQEEMQEEVFQPVSASHSSLSDQQTVPEGEQAQEYLLISPQSSSIGSVDEGLMEALPLIQGTSHMGASAEDDERLESVQYPYHLHISPSSRPSSSGPDRPFPCPTCGVRFTRLQNLKQHMLIHSGIKPFQCDRCDKRFTRAYSLKMHRLKHEVISSSPDT